MRKLYRCVLAILLISLPSVVLAADIEITCFENVKPSVETFEDKLFDISNFLPGQTEVKTLRVENTDPNNNCRIYFKGEGTGNIVTDNIFIAFEGVFGNIVDNKATSNKTISDFLVSEKINVANLNPNEIINRTLVVTYNPLSENTTMDQATNFDVRIISEWGNDVTEENNNQGDVLGTGDSMRTTYTNTSSSSVVPSDGIGGAEDDQGEDVKGLQECDIKTKVFGYVYLDSNNNKKRDDREKFLEDVIITVYTNINEEQISVTKATTDVQGYWKVNLCQGKYLVEVDRSSLPKNSDIEENILQIELVNSEDFYLDIAIDDTRTFLQRYWPWVLLAIGLIGTGVIILVDSRKKRQYV